MKYIRFLKLKGMDIKEIPCIKLNGIPTTSTEGAVGLLGMDVTSENNNIYKCVSAENDVYRWEPIEATVDQIYNAESENPQSGKAVADAISNLNIENGGGEGSLQQHVQSEAWHPNDNLGMQQDINEMVGEDEATIPTGALNNLAIAFGYDTTAAGDYSLSSGEHTLAIGQASHTEGLETYAKEAYSHAEGVSTSARGVASHSEGMSTSAIGTGSHAEGYFTYAKGVVSHASGEYTTATGQASMARGRCNIEDTFLDNVDEEGNPVQKYGKYADIVGNGTYTDPSNAYTLDWEGNGWFAGDVTVGENKEKLVKESDINVEKGEGINSIQQPKDSETWTTSNPGVKYYIEEGYKTADGYSIQSDYDIENLGQDINIIVGAYGKNSSMWGGKSQAIGGKSHAEGSKTIAFENNSHAEGNETFAAGKHSHAEGNTTMAIGNASHAEGSNTVAEGAQSHAEGLRSQALDEYAHAEGVDTVALGKGCHVEGYKSEADQTAEYAHAEGYNTFVNGIGSHAEGMYSHAVVDSAHAEGRSAQANGEASHAEGYNTEANGKGSHAQGRDTVANGDYTMARGKYNIKDTYTDDVDENGNATQTYGEYVDIVGNGKSDGERSNAYTLSWKGEGWFADSVSVGKDKEKLATENFVTAQIGELDNKANANKVANAIINERASMGELTIDDISPLSHLVEIKVGGEYSNENAIPYPYPTHNNEHLTFTVNEDGSIHIQGKSVYAEVFTLATNFTMQSGYKYYLEADTIINQLSGSSDVKVYFYFRPSGANTNRTDVKWRSSDDVGVFRTSYECDLTETGDIRISVMGGTDIDMIIKPTVRYEINPKIEINGIQYDGETHIFHKTNDGDDKLQIRVSPNSNLFVCTYHRDINKAFGELYDGLAVSFEEINARIDQAIAEAYNVGYEKGKAEAGQ